MTHALGRRPLLLGALGALLGQACGGADGPARPAAAPPLTPLKTGSVAELLSVARLRWVILARPREIASTPFLIPAIGRVVSEQNF
ncbi:MAG TPA: hypothetical protein VHB21_10880, partial [Minicystis sp.]|nr:hypothetical protein [Minicystis sp.]